MSNEFLEIFPLNDDEYLKYKSDMCKLIHPSDLQIYKKIVREMNGNNNTVNENIRLRNLKSIREEYWNVNVTARLIYSDGITRYYVVSN